MDGAPNSDVIVLKDDGEWVFAIGIRLGAAVDDEHKQPCVCKCRFTIDDRKVRLYIGDSKEACSINIDDSGSFEGAFEALYNHYRTFFKSRSTASPSNKQRMGFL